MGVCGVMQCVAVVAALLTGVAAYTEQQQQQRNLFDPCYGIAQSKLLLNQSGYVQYVHYYTPVPSLTKFTMTYWFQPLTVNRTAITTFNYALDELTNLDNLTIQVHPQDFAPTYALWTMRINGLEVARAAGPSIHAGQWYHVLHSWDGETGLWSLFVNGEFVVSGYSQHKHLVIPGGGVAVSGQHQDTALNSGMDQGAGLEGWFTLFNLWSVAVIDPQSQATKRKVKHLMESCYTAPTGDVISWRRSPRKGYGGSMETPANLVCGDF